MRFRGTTCDQCKTDGKHPGYGQPDGPVHGWLRIVDDCGTGYDFCSIKCAQAWLKERARQARERVKRARAAAKQAPAHPDQTITCKPRTKR